MRKYDENRYTKVLQMRPKNAIRAFIQTIRMFVLGHCVSQILLPSSLSFLVFHKYFYLFP
jgi:hypothetical protein